MAIKINNIEIANNIADNIKFNGLVINQVNFNGVKVFERLKAIEWVGTNYRQIDPYFNFTFRVEINKNLMRFCFNTSNGAWVTITPNAEFIGNSRASVGKKYIEIVTSKNLIAFRGNNYPNNSFVTLIKDTLKFPNTGMQVYYEEAYTYDSEGTNWNVYFGIQTTENKIGVVLGGGYYTDRSTDSYTRPTHFFTLRR